MNCDRAGLVDPAAVAPVVRFAAAARAQLGIMPGPTQLIRSFPVVTAVPGWPADKITLMPQTDIDTAIRAWSEQYEIGLPEIPSELDQAGDTWRVRFTATVRRRSRSGGPQHGRIARDQPATPAAR